MANEAIEVAGVAGTDLSGWSIVLYNGATGLSYNTIALNGVIPDQQNGFGTLSFTATPELIQNGAPDGFALVDDFGNVLQFLSYEGSFTASDGPANGMPSTDVGVEEGSGNSDSVSLQLTGSGDSPDEFTWSGPISNNPRRYQYRPDIYRHRWIH